MQEEEGREHQQKPCIREEGVDTTCREAGGFSPAGGEPSDINTTAGLMERQKRERVDALVGLVVITAGEVLGVRRPQRY